VQTFSQLLHYRHNIYYLDYWTPEIMRCMSSFCSLWSIFIRNLQARLCVSLCHTFLHKIFLSVLFGEHLNVIGNVILRFRCARHSDASFHTLPAARAVTVGLWIYHGLVSMDLWMLCGFVDLCGCVNYCDVWTCGCVNYCDVWTCGCDIYVICAAACVFAGDICVFAGDMHLVAIWKQKKINKGWPLCRAQLSAKPSLPRVLCQYARHTWENW
jgi:hypothetical protein